MDFKGTESECSPVSGLAWYFDSVPQSFKFNAGTIY